MAVLKTMPDASVHCCVTSPPYWGLRDYGTAKWDGGDPNCDHSPEKRGGRFATPVSGKQASNSGSGTISSRDCPCGAKRIDNQLGLEKTPEEYVAKMVEVFSEVRRVLREDGTLWLNLGDSYAGSWGDSGHRPERDGVTGTQRKKNTEFFERNGHPQAPKPVTASVPGLKPKDLVGIPWMVAFALRADGWYLRSDIIWHKPNPMPESVTDRPTKSHEYIFLLTKSAKYYYDAESIKEDAGGWNGSKFEDGKNLEVHPNVGKVRKSRPRGSFNGKTEAMPGRNAFRAVTETRNKRSVWTVATSPYSEAHFATFPPKLITPCILAGCPERGTVLDPFGGSGTTGLMAESLGRNSILIELKPEYCEMANKRTAQQGLFC